VSCIQNSLARAHPPRTHRTAAAYIHVTHPPPPLRLTTTTTPAAVPGNPGPFYFLEEKKSFSLSFSPPPPLSRRLAVLPYISLPLRAPAAHTYLPSPTAHRVYSSSSSLFLVSYFLLAVVDVVVVLRSRVIDTFRTCLDTRVQRGGSHANGQFSRETLF